MSPPSSASAPSVGYACFTAMLGLSDRQSHKFWQALCACGESDSRTFLFNLERLGVIVHPGQRYHVELSWMVSGGRPTHIVKLIERLVTRKLLSRSEANLIQERVLQKTGNSGLWR